MYLHQNQRGMTLLYRLFLVDDENGQLELMSGILSKMRDNLSIECFTSPDAALAAMKERPAQIVISDIRMPKMDGLSFIRQIRQQYPDTIIAISSAYSDFSYARQAISYSVIDYLLKPVTRQDLQNLLSKIEQQLCHNKESLLVREKKTLVWLTDASLKDAPSFIGCDCSWWLLLFWGPVNKENSSIPQQKMIIVKNLPGASAFHTSVLNQSSGLFTLAGFSSWTQATDAAGLLENVKNLMPSDQTIHIGVSGPNNQLLTQHSQMAETAMQLYDKLFASDTTCCLTEAQAQKLPLIDSREFERLEHTILSAARQLDYERVSQILEDFLLHIHRGNFLCSHALASQSFSHTILLLHRQLGIPSVDTVFKKIDACFSLNELCLIFESHVMKVLKEQSRRNEQGTAHVIIEITQYIGQNLTNDLSLNQIARQFHFNASYLSSIFRRYMGIGLKEYIIKERIEKAKYLLNNTDLKVSQIALQCGYEDNSYFVQLFKRHTGLSPSQYRKGK